MSGAHYLKGGFVIAKIISMGDDGLDIQTRLNHDGHFIPGFIHLPAIDTLDGQAIENDIVPIDGCFRGKYSQKCDLCTVAHFGSMV